LALEQAWPTMAQSVLVWPQVPLIEPAGMMQVKPAQQSPSAVQMSPSPWHETAPQMPSTHSLEQQSAEVVQLPPFGTHEPGSWQM
jgi:hypothetical protein